MWSSHDPNFFNHHDHHTSHLTFPLSTLTSIPNHMSELVVNPNEPLDVFLAMEADYAHHAIFILVNHYTDSLIFKFCHMFGCTTRN